MDERVAAAEGLLGHIAYLDGITAGDTHVRDVIESLLAAYKELSEDNKQVRLEADGRVLHLIKERDNALHDAQVQKDAHEYACRTILEQDKRHASEVARLEKVAASAGRDREKELRAQIDDLRARLAVYQRYALMGLSTDDLIRWFNATLQSPEDFLKAHGVPPATKDETPAVADVRRILSKEPPTVFGWETVKALLAEYARLRDSRDVNTSEHWRRIAMDMRRLNAQQEQVLNAAQAADQRVDFSVPPAPHVAEFNKREKNFHTMFGPNYVGDIIADYDALLAAYKTNWHRDLGTRHKLKHFRDLHHKLNVKYQELKRRKTENATVRFGFPGRGEGTTNSGKTPEMPVWKAAANSIVLPFDAVILHKSVYTRLLWEKEWILANMAGYTSKDHLLSAMREAWYMHCAVQGPQKMSGGIGRD